MATHTDEELQREYFAKDFAESEQDLANAIYDTFSEGEKGVFDSFDFALFKVGKAMDGLKKSILGTYLSRALDDLAAPGPKPERYRALVALMKNAGISEADAVQAIAAVNKLVLYMNLGGDEEKAILRTYAQITYKGTATEEDVAQLAEHISGIRRFAAQLEKQGGRALSHGTSARKFIPAVSAYIFLHFPPKLTT